MYMRNLPTNKTSKHKLIIKAVEDFYNEKISKNRKLIDVAIWLMNRKKGVKLDEEQKIAIEAVRANLADPVYCQKLI